MAPEIVTTPPACSGPVDRSILRNQLLETNLTLKSTTIAATLVTSSTHPSRKRFKSGNSSATTTGTASPFSFRLPST